MKGGLLVKEARLRAGLTQAQLAQRLGTTQPVVARWERGRAKPSFDTVVAALRACGLELVIELMPRDDQDAVQALQNRRLSPQARVEQFLAMLELEKTLRGARRVAARGSGDDLPDADG